MVDTTIVFSLFKYSPRGEINYPLYTHKRSTRYKNPFSEEITFELTEAIREAVVNSLADKNY
jgi:hypothetical protein